MHTLLDVALDGTMNEIKEYLRTNEAKAILELAYDGYYSPDYFTVTDETEKHQIRQMMEDHRVECHGYRWYTIYTLGEGEMFQFTGFDAEYWAAGK